MMNEAEYIKTQKDAGNAVRLLVLPSNFHFQIYGKRLEGNHICINYFIAYSKSNFEKQFAYIFVVKIKTISKMMDSEQKFYRQAYWLSLFTIFYNIIEGIISMILGYEDETLTLFGFGVDSFIEVMSGIGIAMMILHIKQNPDNPKSTFETKALKITGTAFYLLSAGLLVGIILNIINHHKPETTLWGIIISLVSIAVMVWLMNAKKNIGKKLHSEPIIANVFFCIH